MNATEMPPRAGRKVAARCGWAWLAMLALPAITVMAAPPSNEDLLRQADYLEVSISPRGDYLATRLPFDDRTVLAIVRRGDGKTTAKLDPGKEAYIEGSAWVGDERLFASWSRKLGHVAQPYSMWALLSTDVDGSNQRVFHGSVVDPLVDDQERVLVAECAKVVRGACHTRLREASTTGRGKLRDIVDGPVPDAGFVTDRTGRPIFAHATDDDDIQRTYLRRDDAWVPINDESTSGVEVLPLGVSHDLRHGYLWSERREGTDVIERIDLATGARVIVSSDPVSSPSGLVLSFDRSEVIGVRLGTGVPTLHFFDESHPHALLYRELAKAFPEDRAVVSSATRDGRLAVVHVSGDREPGSFYMLDVASGDLSLLVRTRPWLERDALARKVPVTIPARDGLVLHGYLTRPLGATSDVPLVVLVHGGPFGLADVWGFDEEVQMLAAHGYAVLQVNFRGSGGRGRAFVESGYRQWGGLMQDDVTDATRWAQSQPGIDPLRACIWGASYGGYAAVMATVREPMLYACAIGVSGPYDLPTMYTWGDVQRSRWGKGLLGRTLGEDRGALLANSPTQHASRIQVPLLLVQGGRDERVSPQHLRAMRAALDKVRTPYEVYVPSDETHGFFSDTARREYYRRVFAFLGKHLPTGEGTAATAMPYGGGSKDQ